MNSVAIVGGGITGLCAGFRLRERGIPVTIYEAADRVGGPVRTIYEGGFMSEYGPNTILETSPKIGALISDLGLDARRRVSNSGANQNFVVRDGRLVPLPTSAPRFAATPLFSLRAKLRIALEPLIFTPPASEDEPLADFVVRRLGREFLDYAINPFVSGVYAGDPARLSVRHAFPKLHAVEARYRSLFIGQFLGARERKKRGDVTAQRANKLSFDGGLQVLIDALKTRLGKSIRLNSRVTGATQTGDAWTLCLETPEEAVEQTHSAVLLCAPAHQLAALQIGSQSTRAELLDLSALAEIEHPAVARVVLGFRREDVAHPLDGFGFLVPEAERMSILGTTFSSSLFDGRAPAGHVTLTTFLGGMRRQELASRPPGELIDLTLADLRRVLGVRGKPVYAHHAVFSKAIPQYSVGYGRFMDFFSETEKRYHGLFFAGNYRNGISLGNSIIAGQEVAGRIAESLAPRIESAKPSEVCL